VELREKKYSVEFHYISFEYFIVITPLRVGFYVKKKPFTANSELLSCVTNGAEIAQ
jgi:hypothetical protein